MCTHCLVSLELRQRKSVRNGEKNSVWKTEFLEKNLKKFRKKHRLKSKIFESRQFGKKYQDACKVWKAQFSLIINSTGDKRPWRVTKSVRWLVKELVSLFLIQMRCCWLMLLLWAVLCNQSDSIVGFHWQTIIINMVDEFTRTIPVYLIGQRPARPRPSLTSLTSITFFENWILPSDRSLELGFQNWIFIL